MELREFFTVNEVSEILKVWPATVRAWLVKGKLRGRKLPGGDWRIRADDVEAMLESPAGRVTNADKY